MLSSPSISSASLSLPDLSRSSAASPSPIGRNPVSLRLYKVLGATFDDDATKEALNTLSELYSSPETVSSETKKASKEPDSTEDADEPHGGSSHTRKRVNGAGDALGFLEGPPPGDTAAKARKHLRRDIEGKLSEGSQKFLKAFGEVDQKLDALQGHIATMRLRCDEAQAQLQSTNEACRSLLDRAESLRDERQDVNRRQSIVSLFLSRFTLNENEVQAITSADVPVGSRFFAAMDRTQKIREDCRVLMAGEEQPSQAGLDIMATTSAYLEKGYDKIFRWCSFEFRQMGRDSVLEAGSNMQEAVQRLRQRPELLADALGTLSQTRQAALLASFLSALTNPTTVGTRPIELHAHDALRYIGDMLAWVHQAIAAEHEFLESLFGMSDEGRMVGSVRVFGAGSGRAEEEEWTGEMMDGAVSGLCTPLKVRVLQTVRSQENSITAYKIANLLQFYTLTMTRTIGEHALLSKTLKETTDASYKVFFDAIEAQGRALLRVALDPSDPSLTPPPALLTHAQSLRSIIALHSSESEPDEESQMTRILDVMVDPAMQMCVAAAEEKEEQGRRRGKTWDRKVFVLNCLTYLVSVLEAYSFTAEKRTMLDGVIEGRVQELIEEHYENILEDAGLKDAVFAIETNRSGEPLSHLPATQPPALLAALHTFSTWLSSLEAVHSPRLSQLTLSALHTRIHHAALRRLGHTYERLCGEVRRPENRYEAASTLLGGERPFGSVAVLWQIFGLEEEAR
ncbi:oligomeric complex COG6 [Artomyces pyxidatus]|uniref:Oligomeric complex COG6 n=1 Tax=Artomyces pyxidatus TaxID=48021 RepID=A0ACB8T7E6_9AGAM|nr:oligomeric complex COG6 [Artomyces pyxidatus]